MAFKIVWTKQAAKDYDKIINYLAENWSDREIEKFVAEADRFFEVLVQHPEILQKSYKRDNVCRGPINRLTIIIYRIKPITRQIVLIRIRSSRQKSLKSYPPM